MEPLFEHNSLLDLVLKCPKTGLFALINDADRLVEVSYSENLINAMASLITQIRDNTHTNRKLRNDVIQRKVRLVVLESPNDYLSLRHRQTVWTDYYTKVLRYDLYKSKLTLRLTPVIEVHEFKDKVYHAVVFLKAKDRRMLPVGVFGHRKEAIAFIDEFYSKLDFHLVSANNDLTRTYLSTIPYSKSP